MIVVGKMEIEEKGRQVVVVEVDLVLLTAINTPTFSDHYSHFLITQFNT